MSEIPEEQLAELISALPPAPSAWVEAAIELPAARAAVDELVARSLADEAARQAILADLELALQRSGVEPRPELVERLKSQLEAGSP